MEHDHKLCAFSVFEWLKNHPVCPYCGLVWAEVSDEANAYPHWMNACFGGQPAPRLGTWQRILWWIAIKLRPGRWIVKYLE